MIRFFKLTFLIFTIINFSAHSQSVRNISVEQQGNKVLIYYDLKGTVPSATYRIELYSSLDDFNNPLKLVSGNVGNGVTAGHKIIEWRAEEEFGIFEKDIMFEVRGYTPQVQLPAVKRLNFIQPTSASKVKRKKNVPIQWTGAANDSKINIELCRNNDVISTIGYSLPNTGRVTWTVSKSTLPGKNYYLRIVDMNNPDNRAVSQQFKIKNPSGWASIALLAITVSSLIIMQTAQ